MSSLNCADVRITIGQWLAARLLADNPHAKIDRAVHDGFRLAFGREPSADETDESIRVVEMQESLAAARRAAGEPVLTPRGFPKFLDPARAAALVDFCHALLNASEFAYVE